MRHTMSAARILGMCLLAQTVPYTAWAADTASSCQASGWDMSRELKAFAKPPLGAAAGIGSSSTPLLRLDTLYALRLSAQGDVRFVEPPGQAPKAATPMAGLMHFTVPSSGRYRVTVDAPLWIDVVAAEGIVAPSAYTGWHDCSVYRKSVDFMLDAGQSVTLQFSGAATDLVRVTLEPPPTD